MKKFLPQPVRIASRSARFALAEITPTERQFRPFVFKKMESRIESSMSPATMSTMIHLKGRMHKPQTTTEVM
jgi:hypothetical protein